MMTRDAIKEIEMYIDNHERTDPPLYVYYKSLQTNDNGEILDDTGFLTTTDESLIMNMPHVTIYGEEYSTRLNIREWIRSIVTISEIETLDIYEKSEIRYFHNRKNMTGN